MILNAYSIFDNKALVYHAPFFAHTDGSAARMISDTVNDPGTNLSRHPADYVLYRVGQFDDSSGAIVTQDPRIHVVDAIALVRTEAPLPLDGGRPGPRGNFTNGGNIG